MALSRIPFASVDLAVDLGTSSTRICEVGEGAVLAEPSVIALKRRSGEIAAVGRDAKEMVGRTPGSLIAIRPLAAGVIADFEMTEAMLRHFVQRLPRGRLQRMRIAVSVAPGATAVQRRAVEKVTLAAGAHEVYVIEGPVAAAIGAGLPADSATANLVVDVGAGSTDVAVVSLNGIVTSHSLPVAGDAMDEVLIALAEKEHGLVLGRVGAEELKLALGSAGGAATERQLEVAGSDLVTGAPRAIALSCAELARALDEPVSQIAAAVRATLEATPPDLAHDVIKRGILLTGGGSLLAGLEDRLRREFGLPVGLAPSPLTSVVLGAARILEELTSSGSLSPRLHASVREAHSTAARVPAALSRVVSRFTPQKESQ